ncbi:MAG: hypothetical protein M3R54_13445 [Chloroflexota bacterium]|nr:hypothetical protein [Chloroflexota bacterium]
MEIELADQHIFVLEDRLTPDEIRQRAMDRRTGAFGSGLTGLLQRPKAEDIELLNSQHRLEPFWHIAGHARYVYERSHEYAVPASGDEVRELTVHGVTYPAKNTTGRATFAIQAIEHCRNEFSQEIYADGTTGTAVADAASIVSGPRKEVTEMGAAAEGGTIVVPPAQHASSLVRQLIAAMMKPVQAETITEESMALEHIDLYYRPWWAFEFVWKPKDKRGVVEIDAITGQMRQGQALVPQLQRMVTRDSLFDLGADTAGLLIPGGSIAVKVAKMAIDKRQKT